MAEAIQKNKIIWIRYYGKKKERQGLVRSVKAMNWTKDQASIQGECQQEEIAKTYKLHRITEWKDSPFE